MDKKSFVVGFFVSWIKSRVDGSDSKAFISSRALKFECMTISEAKEILGDLSKDPRTDQNNCKPIVVFLDEFSLTEHTGRNAYHVALRSLLKAVSIVVVTMGTNLNAANLTGKALNDSSSVNMLWAQVCTNIFSPTSFSELMNINEPISSLCDLYNFDLEGCDRLKLWLKSCPSLRSGIFQYFLKSLLSSCRLMAAVNESLTLAEIIWLALKGGFFARQKGIFCRLTALVDCPSGDLYYVVALAIRCRIVIQKRKFLLISIMHIWNVLAVLKRFRCRFHVVRFHRSQHSQI